MPDVFYTKAEPRLSTGLAELDEVLQGGHHGVAGHRCSSAEMSYLADAVVLRRRVEPEGVVLEAISILRTGTTRHERTIRELRLTKGGLEAGLPLHEFAGMLPGSPSWTGARSDLMGGSPGDDEPRP